MFIKLICIAALAISCVCAKPGVVAPVAYSAALFAAPAPAFATAQSSQVITRNYNGVAPLAYTAAVAAPLAYSAPAFTAAGPLAYTAAPAYAAAYAAPYATPYAAYPYSPYVL
ncbi:cuticle protein 16.5-like [Ochlerotatus camptorhynchus]|uniref:cuticle protein 16.5-like n=1 Tax=Ochlerotatus camptorhynchus TaxID=644619 RepID=UPI0031DDB692